MMHIIITVLLFSAVQLRYTPNEPESMMLKILQYSSHYLANKSLPNCNYENLQ